MGLGTNAITESASATLLYQTTPPAAMLEREPMILGAHTFIWRNAFDREAFPAVETAAKLGYDSFEVVAGGSDFNPREVKNLLDGLGMKASLSCTASAERSIGSEDPAVRKAGRAFYLRCIETAATIGATNFVGPLFTSGKPPKPRSESEREEERKRVMEELRVVCEHAKRFGLMLAIEPVNRYKSDLINTVEQAIALIDAVGADNLKILFDTYHSNIEEKSLTDAIAAMGSRYLGEVHLCDNDKGAPGSGHIDFPAIAQSLAANDFNGFVVYESFLPFDKDNIWRKLAPTQDELAKSAIDYMRALFPA